MQAQHLRPSCRLVAVAIFPSANQYIVECFARIGESPNEINARTRLIRTGADSLLIDHDAKGRRVDGEREQPSREEVIGNGPTGAEVSKPRSSSP